MKKTKSSILSYLLFLLVLFLGAFMFGMFMNSDGSGSGEFDYYRGPVMPMSSLGGSEGVDAARKVDFDFSPFQTPNAYDPVVRGAARITDTYVLTNTTSEAKTLELVYGFFGSFANHPDEIPAITVNGTVVQPEFRPSMDPEEKLLYSGSYEKYSRILEENDYFSNAMEPNAALDVPVTAYHFTDMAYNGTEFVHSPKLTMRCSLDENTIVWSVGLTGSETEKDGRELLMFSVNDGEAWLFTMGGTIRDPEFGGNKSFNVEKDSAIDGVTFQLETYETTLMEALRIGAKKYAEEDDEAVGMTPELLASSAARRIRAMGYLEAFGIGGFSHIFYEEVHENRMIYLVFPVELAPGQTVTVEASYIQEPSYDISGPKPYREGYDMATRLGSDLDFVDLGASVSNTDPIEITDQNFGFDLEKGVTEVTLDPEVERYYMVVRGKD